MTSTGTTRTRWNDFGTGATASAREIVASAATLLECAVTAAGGGDAARQDLIDGLAAVLALDTEYSTLRLDTCPIGHLPRHELAVNARSVSAHVLDLVDEVRTRPEGTVAPALTDIHSNCVGYTWTPSVIERLIKPSGQHAARNLYNEWLWQLVLLRDSLIPFIDPTRVELSVDADGLNRLVDARDWFIVQLMTRRISHAAIVDFAAEAVLGRHITGAYGFSTPRGRVLPPVVTSDSLLAPAYLLTQDVEQSSGEDPVFFIPGSAEAWTTGGAPIDGTPRAREDVDVVALGSRLSAGESQPDGTQTLELSVGFDGHEWSTDLGQALRGHRYARRPRAGHAPRSSEATDDIVVAAWSGCAVLRVDQGVEAQEGIQLIPTGGQPALGLALLGRLRPGHVVLFEGQDLAALQAELGSDLVLIDVRA